MKSEKDPWGQGTPWPTKAKYFTYLRGCLRLAWNKHPAKLKVIKERRYKIPNPNPKGKAKEVWGFDCEVCGDTHIQKEGQVDHIVAAGSLQDWDDLLGFTKRLVGIREEDLRLICKLCNSILAYADRHNINFTEARAIKLAIAIQKDKKDKEWLKERGITPGSNVQLRRGQIIECLKKEGA